MKHLISFALAAFLLVTSTTKAAVTLTTFGNVSSPSFLVDASTTFPSVNQNGTSTTITGTDLGQVLTGTFDSVDLSNDRAGLRLMGTVASVPTSAFTIKLFDSSFNEALFTGGSWSALSSNGVSNLSFSSANVLFNWSNVVGIELGTSGTGSSLAATLTGLSAVPEPTRALLLGVGMMGLLLRRRRLA